MKLIKFILIFVVFIGLVGSIWFVVAISNPLQLEDGTKFVVEKGEGVNQISYNLKQRGFIRSSFAFETYAYLKDIEHKFQAGKYELPQVVNAKRVIEILTTGQKQEEWKLTVIEGWTVKDIGFRLENLGKFQSAELMEAAGMIPGGRIDFESEYDFLNDKPSNMGLEGYLFPDTYHFFEDASIEDVVNKMLQNFDRKLTDKMRLDIRNQDKMIYEIIIMASIIEREVMNKEDMKTISGIFWNRIEAGMGLQADSTINYITGKKTPAISLEDTKIDSAYNTYKYKGLPPGPISNPGINAIEAAIYPASTDYMYFLTDKEGNVYYAESFDEHAENKNKYLR